MFVDRAKITLKAGEGGKGMIAFRREPHNSRGGPCGGRGGDGGSIYVEADEGLRRVGNLNGNQMALDPVVVERMQWLAGLD